MPRLAGVDIPDNKKIRYSLRYIHGIGPTSADKILSEAGIDVDKRAQELTDQEVGQLASIIDAGYIIEGALRRQVQQHIQRLKDIRSYRGDRHRKGCPSTVSAPGATPGPARAAGRRWPARRA